jgi:hypothetical protein
VALLKCQGLIPEVLFAGHQHLAQKALLVVIVELFDHTVSPGLGQGNEPGVNDRRYSAVS